MNQVLARGLPSEEEGPSRECIILVQCGRVHYAGAVWEILIVGIGKEISSALSKPLKGVGLEYRGLQTLRQKLPMACVEQNDLCPFALIFPHLLSPRGS